MTQSLLDSIRPAPDELTRFYWDAARRHELAIQRCRGCGRYNHWPVARCKRCWSTDLAPEVVSGIGTVYSFAIGAQAFHPWFENRLPYVLAVIELSEQPGLKLVSNVVECPVDEVRCDMAVEVCFEDIDDTLTLPMFRRRAALSDRPVEFGLEVGSAQTRRDS